jgi:hypothetical protein
MTFELLPVIDIMLDLYEKPRNLDRFKEYLALLQGDTKGDLAVPLGGFNPMGKEHVAVKLQELRRLDAERLMQQTLLSLNNTLAATHPDRAIKVALNLSDDVAGGWTNRYTSDYQNKFQIQALVKRNFCTPVFWTSEEYSETLMQQRTQEQVYRTLWVLDNGKPVTLEAHVLQEAFVAKKCNDQPGAAVSAELTSFYDQHRSTEDYSIIFCFMYGDEAAASLGYPTFGITVPFAGFRYAASI